MKNQEKVKVLMNSADVGNESWYKQIFSTWFAVNLKLWDAFNYRIWDTMIGIWSLITALQLYLTWAPAQFLEHVTEFQCSWQQSLMTEGCKLIMSQRLLS